MKNLIIVIHILFTLLLVGCADKGVYVGEKKDDKRHGQGTVTYPDGGKYVGGWKDGKRHGQATTEYPDGRKYLGEYKRNRTRRRKIHPSIPRRRRLVRRWFRGAVPDRGARLRLPAQSPMRADT